MDRSEREREGGGNGIKMTKINIFRSINHRQIRGNIDIAPPPSSLILTSLLAASNEAVILSSVYINTRTHRNLTSVVLAAKKTLLSSVNDEEVYILRKALLSIPFPRIISLAHYYLALSIHFPPLLLSLSSLTRHRGKCRTGTYLRRDLIFITKFAFASRSRISYGNFNLIERCLKSLLKN